MGPFNRASCLLIFAMLRCLNAEEFPCRVVLGTLKMKLFSSAVVCNPGPNYFHLQMATNVDFDRQIWLHKQCCLVRFLPILGSVLSLYLCSFPPQVWLDLCYEVPSGISFYPLLVSQEGCLGLLPRLKGTLPPAFTITWLIEIFSYLETFRYKDNLSIYHCVHDFSPYTWKIKQFNLPDCISPF